MGGRAAVQKGAAFIKNMSRSKFPCLPAVDGEKDILLKHWRAFKSDAPADRKNLNMFQTYLNVYWIGDGEFLKRMTGHGHEEDVRELKCESMQGWWNQKNDDLKGFGLSKRDMKVHEGKFHEKMMIKFIDILFNRGEPWKLRYSRRGPEIWPAQQGGWTWWSQKSKEGIEIKQIWKDVKSGKKHLQELASFTLDRGNARSVRALPKLNIHADPEFYQSPIKIQAQ